MNEYTLGLAVAFTGIAVAFLALARERDDLHRLLLTDLAEILALAVIALVGTDLAEALILPGLVVGISELMALSEIYLKKEKLYDEPSERVHFEVMDTAPGILAAVLVVYGLVLAGFSGGVVAGLGVIFWFLCKGHQEQFELLETVSGYAWAAWIGAFLVFMFLPHYWFFAVMVAGSAVLVKVMTKMSLLGTMRGGQDA